MDNKCPKCGAKATTIVNWSSGRSTFDFACGTEQMPGGLVRGDDCYKAELAALKKLLREAGGLFNKWLYLEKRGLLSCAFSPKTLARETGVFLATPNVVKAMEEKP